MNLYQECFTEFVPSGNIYHLLNIFSCSFIDLFGQICKFISVCACTSKFSLHYGPLVLIVANCQTSQDRRRNNSSLNCLVPCVDIASFRLVHSPAAVHFFFMAAAVVGSLIHMVCSFFFFFPFPFWHSFRGQTCPVTNGSYPVCPF